MSTVLLQTDDEGEVASYSRDTTNDRGNIGLIPLSDGRGGDNRKGRKADDEGFGAHGGRLGWVCWTEAGGWLD